MLQGAGKVIEADFDSAATVPRALFSLHDSSPSSLYYEIEVLPSESQRDGE